MHVFTSPLGQKIYRFDKNDIIMLMLISLGATSCTDLSGIMNISKPAVTQRIEHLSKHKLVNSVENYNEKHYYKKYQITKLGIAKLNGIITDRYVA
jgi:Mn-dependent DtxR family transcriptional regulator